MDKINSTIITIPNIATNLASIIVAEIRDINRFESPRKVLAFVGLEPSTHQSGNYKLHMQEWLNAVLNIFEKL